MKRLAEFFYWRGHGFTWAQSWNYSRDPRKPPTPAWKVDAVITLLYTTVTAGAAAGVAIFFLQR